MQLEHWVLCPICQSKTRTKIRTDSVLENFPLFCPKCKKEFLVNIKHLEVTVIKEPDAEPIAHKNPCVIAMSLT